MIFRTNVSRCVCIFTLALALIVPASVHADAVPLVETTDYMHARYYSPNLGRFLSVDPVGGTIGSSQSWNRYSYVLNNPVGLVDPNGQEPVTIAITLGVAGAALLKAAGVTVFVGSAVGTAILLDNLIHSNDVPAPPIVVTPVDGSSVPTLDGADNPGYVDGSLAAPPPTIDGASTEPSADTGPISTPITDPAVGTTTMSSNRDGAGRNDPHGDGGRAQTKADQQVQALQDQLASATGREKKRIKQKIQNIRRAGERAKKGETHHKKK